MLYNAEANKSLDPGNECIISKIFLDAIRSKARGRKGIRRLKISLSSMQHTPVVSVAGSTSRMKRSSGLNVTIVMHGT